MSSPENTSTPARVVVVGASSGLGRCVAIGLGQRGDKVALLARRKDRLDAAAEEAGPTPSPSPATSPTRTRCGPPSTRPPPRSAASTPSSTPAASATSGS